MDDYLGSAMTAFLATTPRNEHGGNVVVKMMIMLCCSENMIIVFKGQTVLQATQMLADFENMCEDLSTWYFFEKQAGFVDGATLVQIQ